MIDENKLKEKIKVWSPTTNLDKNKIYRNQVIDLIDEC